MKHNNVLESWTQKVILEKVRPDGSCEVTIQVPARHPGMFNNQSGLQEQFVDVRKTETTLSSSEKTDDELKTDDKMNNIECEEDDYEEAIKEEMLSEASVFMMNKKPRTQSSEHKLVTLHDNSEKELLDKIDDFEKEYKEVVESLVQQSKVKESVSVVLETAL